MSKAKKEEVEVVEEVVTVSSGTCAECNGTGLQDANHLCPGCEGHGR